MYKFSKRSLDKLDTCDYRLRAICKEAILLLDFSVLDGHRTKDNQDKAVADGKSKVEYPNSKHNSLPSLAIDIAPYPIDWDDRERFTLLAGLIIGIASQKGYVVRWGGAWNGLSTMNKNRFDDLVHFELVD